jgi:hypothetical protein
VIKLNFPGAGAQSPGLPFWIEPGARNGQIAVIWIDKVEYRRVQ